MDHSTEYIESGHFLKYQVNKPMTGLQFMIISDFNIYLGRVIWE